MRIGTVLGMMILLAVWIGACARPAAPPTPTPSPPPRLTPTPIPTPTPTPIPTPTPNAWVGVRGIVDPTNFGWPREVEGLNGRVRIPSKPQNIHPLSGGLAEVVYLLVPPERVPSINQAAQDATYSNVAHLAQRARGVGWEPEAIIAQRPELVLAARFDPANLVQAIQRAGVPIVQVPQRYEVEGIFEDILFVGYVLGEEERARQVERLLRARLKALEDAIPAGAPRPRVLSVFSFGGQIYAAARGSIAGMIIGMAGGINAAAEAGITPPGIISVESIVSMNPDVIIIPQKAEDAEAFRQRLLTDAALANVSAIRHKRVYPVPPKYFGTLSPFNIRGAEEVAKLLWPDALGGREFPPLPLMEPRTALLVPSGR
ncbi:MAG: ABC transporter substrate-binding protein [Dehalococcoidia bacterium]|nr:ABC transporter substrate-binding protein [Dehalococcoidia bacterium]MDW8119154.1 ABC transporter substrate-binding protein [Chloroflexota bacterium]